MMMFFQYVPGTEFLSFVIHELALDTSKKTPLIKRSK